MRFGCPLAARLCGLLLALAASGCGNNPYPPGETAQSVIYRTMGDDPRTLDPSVSYRVDEAQITDVIYPSYFQYHYLKRTPVTLELALGAEMPRREPYIYSETDKQGHQKPVHGESWSFRLKPGLHFQDDPCFPGGKGREITAADVIYSFRRMADPTVHCPVVGFFQDKIIGFADYIESNAQRGRQGGDYKAPVGGLQLDPGDPYKFRILLNQPYPQLRFLMAMHFTTPIAHEAVERYGKDLARHPVGCGPFVMTEYTHKQRIVLEKNPNRRPEYYPTEGDPGDREAGLLADAGKPLPLADKVVFTVIPESITGWNLFQQGYLDSWGVTQENFSQVMSRQGQLSPDMVRKGIKLRRSVDPNIFYFGFNMNDPVVGGNSPAHRKLRQAISLSINSQDFIDLFSQGYGQPAQFIVPPGLFGYDAKYKNPYRQFDPSLKLGKKLLAEAGYTDGVDGKTGERLVIYFDNSATTAAGRQMVGLITKQVEALGINLESRSFRDIVWQDKIDKGQYQTMYYGWSADYPDPENFLFLFYGPNKRPGPNAVNYENPEYDRMFEQMRSMDDGPARLDLIRKMRDVAVEDCPWVYLFHDENLGISYDWLTNGKPHPASNDTIKYRGIDGPRRARQQAEWNRPLLWPIGMAVIVLVIGSIPAANTVRRRRGRRARRAEVKG